MIELQQVFCVLDKLSNNSIVWIVATEELANLWIEHYGDHKACYEIEGHYVLEGL